jgi:hypothetical protein
VEAALTGTVEGGVGIPGGTEPPFHYGDLQQRKRRFSFSRSKPISFEKNWAKLRRGSKNSNANNKIRCPRSSGKG